MTSVRKCVKDSNTSRFNFFFLIDSTTIKSVFPDT